MVNFFLNIAITLVVTVLTVQAIDAFSEKGTRVGFITGMLGEVLLLSYLGGEFASFMVLLLVTSHLGGLMAIKDIDTHREPTKLESFYQAVLLVAPLGSLAAAYIMGVFFHEDITVLAAFSVYTCVSGSIYVYAIKGKRVVQLARRMVARW